MTLKPVQLYLPLCGCSRDYADCAGPRCPQFNAPSEPLSSDHSKAVPKVSPRIAGDNLSRGTASTSRPAPRANHAGGIGGSAPDVNPTHTAGCVRSEQPVTPRAVPLCALVSRSGEAAEGAPACGEGSAAQPRSIPHGNHGDNNLGVPA